MSPNGSKTPARTWAVGDVHGCYRSLEALLEKISFREESDRLWLVGDLVNRGTGSREVLRWARSRQKQLGDRFRVVLGNHDLHLLAVHHGINKLRRGDTLGDVLGAKDRAKLVGWLARQPLLYREPGWLLVHAGLLPTWSAKDAEKAALRIQKVLTSADVALLLARQPNRKLPSSVIELRHHLAVLTRLRMFHRNGQLAQFSGPPENAPAQLTAWYENDKVRWKGRTVVCGHWAAQGLRLESRMLALDTACVWGKKLTAVHLEKRRVVQVRCQRADLPS